MNYINHQGTKKEIDRVELKPCPACNNPNPKATVYVLETSIKCGDKSCHFEIRPYQNRAKESEKDCIIKAVRLWNRRK